jgi:two-component system CheB/CheR fusion protein
MASDPQQDASGKLRILVVEDNPDAAASTAMLLHCWGYDVEVAGDGPSALEKARARLPHVVLLDITLPGMDGYEVARQLRSLPTSQWLWIIAISGHTAADSHTSDIDLHFLKPMDPVRLRNLLKGLAGS